MAKTATRISTRVQREEDEDRVAPRSQAARRGPTGGEDAAAAIAAAASGGPPTAAELVALQRVVGNQAVLSRLVQPVGQAVAHTPALVVRRKAGYSKAKGCWESDHPALINQRFASKAAAEKAEETAKKAKIEEPKPLTIKDNGEGGAFTKVLTKEEQQQETRLGFDTDALAAQVDGHRGRVNLMAVPFAQLVNGLEAKSELYVGEIQEKYYDGAAERAKGAAGKWSVAVSIDALSNWEIHAHCDLEGNTARDENAIHIKRTSERFSRGVSIALTARQEELLIPPAEERLEFDIS